MMELPTFFVMEQVDDSKIDALIKDQGPRGFKTENEIDRATSFARVQYIRSCW